jgi:hypothetical protein
MMIANTPSLNASRRVLLINSLFINECNLCALK